MVTVRSTHLNKDGIFDSKKWTISLGIYSQPSCERLAQTLTYYLHTTQGHADARVLLFRGIEMAEILSLLSIDVETLLAALLFPLVDSKLVTEGALRASVGQSVAALIHGVYSIAGFNQLKSIYTNSVSLNQFDNISQILFIVNDFRCIVIKLAERITYLREMKNALENERVMAAKECTNIYMPLANRLGISQLKWELEDYCFRYLYPKEYKHIAKLLHERRIDREHYIEEFVSGLYESIKKEGVQTKVYGRPKHIYSIWRKMQKKHLTFNELFDLNAVRVIAESLKDCYTALKIIHTHFCHLPNQFDDYIASPKPNGYQSIHTVVICPNGKPIEIQIRTRKMHEDAELGVAAHWRYKEDPPCMVRLNLKYYIARLQRLIA